VSLPVDSRSLAYFVEHTDSWDVDAGTFKVWVGPDSEHLSLHRNLVTLMPQHLTTRDSNPLPVPLRTAVQVSESQAY
jgi:beta-glucosidase